VQLENLFVLALIVITAVVIWRASQPKKKRRDVPTLRRELERMTHDRDAAERLLEAERARSPGLSELALLQRVITRLEHERRR
jgi:hypothetical protein